MALRARPPADDAVAEYLRLIGAPPEAATWPDDRFYPRLLPPRVLAFVNRHARHQSGRPLPACWERDRSTQRHQCYATAAAMALRNSQVAYTEGIDFHADVLRPIPHAWLTDRNGEVVELSARNPIPEAYFGVVIPTAHLRALLTDGIARRVLPVLIEAGWIPERSRGPATLATRTT